MYVSRETCRDRCAVKIFYRLLMVCFWFACSCSFYRFSRSLFLVSVRHFDADDQGKRPFRRECGEFAMYRPVHHGKHIFLGSHSLALSKWRYNHFQSMVLYGEFSLPLIHSELQATTDFYNANNLVDFVMQSISD